LAFKDSIFTTQPTWTWYSRDPPSALSHHLQCLIIPEVESELRPDGEQVWLWLAMCQWIAMKRKAKIRLEGKRPKPKVFCTRKAS
jgi:hypothetical protein